jgi:hypothetical protein
MTSTVNQDGGGGGGGVTDKKRVKKSCHPNGEEEWWCPHDGVDEIVMFFFSFYRFVASKVCMLSGRPLDIAGRCSLMLVPRTWAHKQSLFSSRHPFQFIVYFRFFCCRFKPRKIHIYFQVPRPWRAACKVRTPVFFIYSSTTTMYNKFRPSPNILSL